MTSDHKTMVGQLIEWYRQLVNPFLNKVESPKAAEFDQDVERLLLRVKKLDEELVICFLGSSGVGKSTLINALVAGKEILLPAGGVGPLTALALKVRYGDTRRFQAKYHSQQNLWNIVWRLQEVHKKESASALPTHRDDLVERMDAESLAEAQLDLFESPDAEPEERIKRSERMEQFKKLAQLMVKGNQDLTANMGYLADSLRTAVGLPMIFNSEIQPEDQVRINRIREALHFARSDRAYICESSGNDVVFKSDLKIHASGYLAPLIKEIDVYWDTELLRDGLCLVDLPGVGIAGDVHREVTRYWIREKARGVVLVVDSRGITDESAQLLWKSGFLNSLLFSADDPIDDPLLMVAVVKVDDIADTRYAEDESKSKLEHMDEVCAESIEKVRGQIKAQLEKVWAIENQNVSDSKRQVIDNIINTLQIHPLSAIQYRRVLKGQPADPPFIAEASQSKVPGLAGAIKSLVAERKARQLAFLRELTEDFFARATGTLKLIEAEWQEDTRATEEAVRLRSELMEFIEPRRKDFHSRQGAFREFLRNTIPQRIEALVKDASRRAEKDIDTYLATHRTTHWGTLKAAVRRGGTFDGSRHIDLPNDFALRFEEPIAEVWGKAILKDIRSRTKEFADDCVDIVEELAEWTKDKGARVNSDLIESQRDAIRADAKRLNTIGKEMVEELRARVKADLIKSIHAPIQRRCKLFVERGDAMGRGVKDRILELFRELADTVVAAATEPAIQLLTTNFRLVEEEIRTIFKQYNDPLMTAVDSIVGSHETRTRRSDAQRRKTILEEVREVLSASPDPPKPTGAKAASV